MLLDEVGAFLLAELRAKTHDPQPDGFKPNLASLPQQKKILETALGWVIPPWYNSIGEEMFWVGLDRF